MMIPFEVMLSRYRRMVARLVSTLSIIMQVDGSEWAEAHVMLCCGKETEPIPMYILVLFFKFQDHKK